MANILGINLSEFKASEVLAKIAAFLNSQTQHYIVTPNPEIILEANRDEEFFYILNKASLSLADGFGLKIAGLIQGKNIPRVTGSDLTLKLLEKADREGIKVLILNWNQGLSTASEINESLKQKYPQLNFLVLDISRDAQLPEVLIEKINTFSPQLLFSTLGFPYQEKNIYHNLSKLPSVRVALGVGGSFDFITGKIKRAPRILRSLGLEWLWRLIKQPRRLKRIYRATFVFLAQVLRGSLFRHFLYRPNVVCLVYKKETNGSLKILLVERENEPGHWQMPQGGLDGEKAAIAGAREIREELGTDKIIPRGIFKNVYRYKFPNPQTPNSTIDVIEAKKYKFDYKGQKQDLFVAEFTGADSDIKISFWDHSAWKWVDAENLVAEVYEVRKKSAAIFLTKFKTLNL